MILTHHWPHTARGRVRFDITHGCIMCTKNVYRIGRVGQNRIYTPYIYGSGQPYVQAVYHRVPLTFLTPSRSVKSSLTNLVTRASQSSHWG